MIPVFSSSSMPEDESVETDSTSDLSPLLRQASASGAISSQPVSRGVPNYGSLSSVSPASSANLTLSNLEVDRIQLKLVALIGLLTDIKESGGDITLEDRAALVSLERSLQPFLGGDEAVFDVRAVQERIREMVGVSSIDGRLSVVESWAESQDPGSIFGVPQIDPSARCYHIRRSCSYFRHSRHPIIKLCREISFILGVGFVYDWFTFSCFKYCADKGLDCFSVSKDICNLIKSCIDKISQR
ncbi:hypothetical protein [Candidatus Ichthyocystis hellenicum]|uniref:hypothetical protein n=1 Tax=Candidatus Ichthyocystis hellenicum TaxID=1561003 RepID=UPI000B80C43B|nr:hypothetical protein [Candidatus Ichthyocystis hellenicum]